MRSGWDSGNLGVMTRRSPLTVTDAHISIVAHTTQEELLRHLDRTEAASGLYNRFLWVSVRRTQLLPEGGQVPERELENLRGRLRSCIEFARDLEEMNFTESSARKWRKEYARLGATSPGLLGEVTSRAEPQVRRLACIYAILQKSAEVKLQHLRAAMAVWKYCYQSARFIFGGRQAQKMEDKLLEFLPTAGSGLTRTEISAKFHHHVRGDEIVAALENLRENGLAKPKSIKTSGRPAEYWVAIPGGDR
jgi:hypothetical protein